MLPDRLTKDQLFDPSGDPAWRTLLAHTARFEDFLDQDDAKTVERCAAAESLRHDLIEAARRLRVDRPGLVITREHERWFTESILVWQAYRDTASAPLIDTVGTQTAHRFALDLEDDDAVAERLEDALKMVFGWREDELREMKDKLVFLTSNLRLKHAIVDAIIARVGHTPTPGEVHDLGEEVFGSLPTRPGDFDLVVTRSAFFFCIPFDSNGPLLSDLDHRPQAEQAAVRGFVDGVNTAAMSAKHVRFPAFGFFEPNCVSEDLLQYIERHLNALGMEVQRKVLADTLATMVTILPTQKLDMYLVHDIWGHGWQESLCEFEWIFERLVDNAHAVTPFDGVESIPALTAGFVSSDVDGTRFVPAPFLAAVDADLRTRIEAGINGIMAECLADLSEYKFIVEEDPDGHLMPTSSLLRKAAVKLDFTLLDTQMNQKSWSRPYRVLLGRASARNELRADLTRQGCAEEGLDEAISEAREMLEAHFNSAFVKHFNVVDEEGDALATSVGQRVFVAMCLLAAGIEDFADDRVRTRGQHGPQWESPSTSIDLLMLSLGWFFDQDRRGHIWQMDRLLDHVIRPLLVRLEAALVSP